MERRVDDRVAGDPPNGVCVVAGATGKLGSAIAARLTARGCTVIGIARDREALDAAVVRTAGRVEACPADIRDDDAVASIREAVGDRSVRMVVNATRSVTPGALVEVTAAAISEAVELKVGGLLRLVRATERRLGEGSRIVALGGRLGYDPDPRAAAAGIANAGVANLVRQLALAYGPRGVTCHVVAPGAVQTADDDRARPSALGPLSAEHATATPLRRLPTPADIAWAVDMLSAPEAAFLNGSSLILDGGQRTAIP